MENNTVELNVLASPPEKPLTPEEKKAQRIEKERQEKAEKRQRDYMNSMVTRLEATQLSTSVARKEFSQGWEFVRESIKAAILQSMAVYLVLEDKGLIDKETFNEYLAKAQSLIEKNLEGEANGEEESGEKPNNESDNLDWVGDNTVEAEAEEQQGEGQ